MRYEVCDGHVARQDERDRTSEQAEHNQHPADKLNHTVDAGERHGGHPRGGRNGQAQIFRHPMLQEQQADHDAQDTQHTWGPRCEKAVDRRHHNFSYERPEACQTPRQTPQSWRAFYNSLAGRRAVKGPPAVKREAKERMGQKEMVMIAAGECWRSRSLGVFMACLIETAGDATAVSVLLSFALTAVLAQGAASAVCFR